MSKSYEQQLNEAAARHVPLTDVQDCFGYAKNESDEAFLRTLAACETFGLAGFETGTKGLTAYQRWCRIRRDAAKKGVQHGMSPDYVGKGFEVTDRTVAIDGEGNIQKQWIRSKAGAEERADSLKEAYADYFEPLRNQPEVIVQSDIIVNPNQLAVYPLGDPHIGMYAWHAECGQDFDCIIAEDNLCAAIDVLVAKTEPAYTGLLVNIGDYFHTDRLDNVTARSGNSLDVDTRWPQVLRVGANIQRYLIHAMLQKHAEVVVWNVPGNHDDQSAVAVNLAMQFLFEQEDRVTVCDNADPFFYHKHGEVLLGATHGDKCKMATLPGLMACDRKEDWGSTSYRHWYTGHVHHDRGMNSQEYAGVTVESLRTLAPKDYYAHSHGYRAEQEMKSDVWDRQYGRVSRSYVNMRQLWDQGAKGKPQ